MKTNVTTAAIVTLYHPKQETSESLGALGKQVTWLILSDNTPGADNRAMYAGIPNAVYLANGENLGLSAGINRGLETAEARESGFVFFFDQDSRVPEGHIAAMVRDWAELAKEHRIGLLGPRFYDEITGAYNADAILDAEVEESGSPWVPIGQMITSSMMTTWGIMKEIGFWNEEIFLDYGDYDLCWRLAKAGYELFITKNVLLKHRLGEGFVMAKDPKSKAVFPLAYGAPIRKYYQTRAAVKLLRKDYVPEDWRKLLKQNLTIRRYFDLKYLPDKRKNTYYYHRGLLDGFLNRRGAFGRKKK